MAGSRIGFVGLGIMGKPMALNLIRAGFDLLVCDINPRPVEEVTASGAQSAPTVKAMGSECSIFITMLPDGPDVESVCLGENGLIHSIRPGALVIDMSSIAPPVTLRIGAALRAKKCRLLDAPVSGGEPGAVAATLSIMVGGEQADFEEARPILEKVGKSVTWVGPLGAGQTAKLVNQILVAVHIAAMGEAFCLAAKSHVDPRRVFSAIRNGLAGSNVLNAKMDRVLERKFDPGFKMRLHQKDLQNALQAGKELGMCLPLTGLVQQMMTRMVGEGRGEEDHGGLVQIMEQMNDVIIEPIGE